MLTVAVDLQTPLRGRTPAEVAVIDAFGIEIGLTRMAITVLVILQEPLDELLAFRRLERHGSHDLVDQKRAHEGTTDGLLTDQAIEILTAQAGAAGR
jgi:hypothetical protein